MKGVSKTLVHSSNTHTNRAPAGLASATRHVLSNGMVALIHRNPTSPTVSIRGEVSVGAANETASTSGLSAFTAAALIRGTEKRSFQQIVAETEAIGCSVNAGGGMHISSFSGKALVEDVPLVFEMLADMLICPTFPPQEVEKLRAQFLMQLREYEEETHVQASRAAMSLLYPPEHPYSRLSSGTQETVSAITRDELAAFQRLYHPARCLIAVVGDVQPDAIIADLERFFGQWRKEEDPTPAPDLPVVPPLTQIARKTIPMGGKVQSDILWCVHGIKRTDPDYYAAVLGNMILGRIGMGGRLGDNVREKQGLAYSVSSGLQAGKGAGPWAAEAGVSPADVDRAIESILHEIEQFKQHGPTDEELSDARAFLTGSLVLRLETNSGLANALLDIETYNLGLDFIERYPDIINRVTHEEIVTVARTYLSTERYVLTVAGPPMS